MNTTEQWQYTTSSGTATGSADHVHYIDASEWDHKWDNSSWYAPRWKIHNADVYIDGEPVGKRIEELQDCIKMLHGILKKKFHCVARDDKLTKLVENLTRQEKIDLDKMEEEQEKEKEYLDDELFKI